MNDYFSYGVSGLLFLILVSCVVNERNPSELFFDVVVVGATPGGVSAAVNAAREGVRVALIQDNNHIGGLASGGLSSPDFRSFEALNGTFLEFMQRIERYYIDTYGADSPQTINCVKGTYPEPRVARLVFEKMLDEANVKVFTDHQLLAVTRDSTSTDSHQVVSGQFLDHKLGTHLTFNATVFIDGTYEGDLLAASGVPYRTGREARDEFNEELAPEESDHHIQAYNFRVVMTTDPDNQIPIEIPENYDRENYLPLIPYIEENEINSIDKISHYILRIRRMPNDKAEFNDVRFAPLSLSRTGINNDWPEGGYEKRAEIFNIYKDWSLGLIYFLQNDQEVPAVVRNILSKWALPADEYTDTDHWTPALYVREGRRMVGRYVFTEHDTDLETHSVRSKLQTRSVAISDYSINTHGVYRSNEEEHLGTIGRSIRPIQIPYDIMIPEFTDGLIVPVAVSASHVGFAALRYEPAWVALGQAAGLAAAQSIKQNVAIRDVDVRTLQLRLHALGAMTIYVSKTGKPTYIQQPEWEQPKDPILISENSVPPENSLFRPVQFWGTYGFFHNLVDPDTAVNWNRGPGIANKGTRQPYHSIEHDKKVSPELAENWLNQTVKLGFSTSLTVEDIMERSLTRGEMLRFLFESANISPDKKYFIKDSVEIQLQDADGISIGDLSQDGKMDIIGSSGKGGQTVWFEQGENWKDWNRHVIYTSEREKANIEGNITGDLDNDGIMEVVSLDQYNGNIYIHKSGESPRDSWQTHLILDDRPYLQNAKLQDVDLDGKLDIIYTWQGSKEGEGGINWLKLEGEDPLKADDWTDFTMIRHEGAWWLAPHFTDLTGNGLMDDLVFSAKHFPRRNAASKPGVYWLQAPPNVRSQWILHTIDSTLYRPAHIDLGNLIGNGHRNDVIVSGFETNSLYWYEFGNNWKRHQIEIPQIDGLTPDYIWNVKTIKLDHFHDAIMTPVVHEDSKTGALLLFNYQEGQYVPQQLRRINYTHPMDDRIILYDFTGDGNPEVLIPDSGPNIDLIHILKLEQRQSHFSVDF